MLFIFSMNKGMTFQSYFVSIRLATCFACMQFLSSLNKHMLSQTDFLGKDSPHK